MFSQIIKSLYAPSDEVIRYLEDGGVQVLQNIFKQEQISICPLEDFRPLVVAIMHAYNATTHPSAKNLCSDIELAFRQELLQLNSRRAEIASWYYQLIYCLYWCGAATSEETSGFDEHAVKPFVPYADYLCRSNFWAPAPLRIRKDSKIRIGYLCAFLHEGPGNAIGPMEYSLFAGYQKLNDPNIEIFAYAWKHSTPEFLQKIRTLGVAVREYRNSEYEDRLREIRLSLCQDRLDVLITDMNLDVPAILFQSRVAPLQIYFQLGMPYWAVPEVDAFLAGWHAKPELFGFKPETTFPIHGSQHRSTLVKDFTPEEIQAERIKYPTTRWLIGTFGRLAKITSSYLEIAKEVVQSRDDVTVLIGGVGGGEIAQAFIKKHDLQNRIILVPEFVDGKLWARILDVFLDTFPNNGGNACREALACGKPAVHMKGLDMPNLELERDPALIASTNEEYVKIVLRLLSDDTFRQGAAQQAVVLCEKITDFTNLTIQVNDAVKRMLKRTPKHSSSFSDLGQDETLFSLSCLQEQQAMALAESFKKTLKPEDPAIPLKLDELSRQISEVRNLIPERMSIYKQLLQKLFNR